MTCSGSSGATSPCPMQSAAVREARQLAVVRVRSGAAESLRLLAERSRGDPAARGLRAGVQPPVPDSDDQFGVADGQGASEVDGVGAAQCVSAGELARA